jgi:peptide chain release factor 3
VVLKDPLKMKSLAKGLQQLCEEGATQLFRPFRNNDMIVGAVGVLQFDVTASRLKLEYNVDCIFENISIHTARWVSCDNAKELQRFRDRASDSLAEDGSGHLVFLASSRVNLDLTIERWPDIQFLATREHGGELQVAVG